MAQTCLFFIVNMEKLKLELQNKPRPKCTGEITTPNMFFFWVLLYPRTTDPLTNRPPTTYPPIYRQLTQRLAEYIIILERLSIRELFILQNISKAGKTYNYTSVYYPKSLLVSIKHIRKSQLYLFF